MPTMPAPACSALMLFGFICVWSLIVRVDMIGGYPSTVFLTVPVDKVRFIFAADAASLVRPLNILFRDATDVEWMQ